MKRFILIAFLACFSAASAAAQAATIKAAVFRSRGTVIPDERIWSDMNSGWSAFGDTPIQIDYTSLATNEVSLAQIQATNADVLILSSAGAYGKDSLGRHYFFTPAEVTAIIDYVQAGHGLIITFEGFREGQEWLASLAGISKGGRDGGGVSACRPIEVQSLNHEHILFNRISFPYMIGDNASYVDLSLSTLSGGTVLANLVLDDMIYTPAWGIVTNETSAYRSVYFSYGVDDKLGGANSQDMQMFYNSLLWTAPEPITGIMFALASACLCLHRPKHR